MVAVSVAMYIVGQTISGLRFAPGAFPVADWQLLFTAGLLTGWTWEHERNRLDRRWRRAIVGSSVVVGIVLYACAVLAPESTESLFGSALWKANGGWLAFSFAGAMLVAGYALIERARRTSPIRRSLRPVEILGTKGLPGYAAMVLFVLMLDLVPSAPRNDAMLVVAAAVCGVAEYTAVQFNRQVRRRIVVAAAASAP